MTSRSMLEELVTRVAQGDDAAWRMLWEDLEPRLLAMIARPRFFGRLGQRDDDRRSIVVEVMARLRADGFRRLRGYVATRARNPSLELEPWLRVVAKRVAIDFLLSHGDNVEHPGGPQTLTASDVHLREDRR